MKYLYLSLFLLICTTSQANFWCSKFINPEKKVYNLTERTKDLKSSTVDEILNDPTKTWVKTRSKEYRAYKYIAGKKGKPLILFMMGLGGSIEESMDKNLILKRHIRQGHHVVLMEGTKLGDTAILASKTSSKSDFKKNMEGFEDLFSVLIQEQNPDFSSLIIAGHSYGAYGASHLASVLEKTMTVPITLQLFAPAVTNFNNRLNPNWLNTAFEGFTNYLDFFGSNAGYKLQVKEVSKALKGALPELEKDPIKLQMSAELTVDAGTEHILEALKKLSPTTQIQLFLGSEEGFLFPMMHFELYQSLVQLGLKVIIFNTEHADHFVTDKITDDQASAMFNPNPKSSFNPLDEYYLVKSNGALVKYKITKLENELKISSLKMWNEYMANQNIRYVYFGAVPIKDINSFYPVEWMPESK